MLCKTNIHSTNTRKRYNQMLTGLLNRGCNRKVNSPFGNEGYTLTSEGQTEVNIHGFGYGYKKIT